jgi:hypothetical protein
MATTTTKGTSKGRVNPHRISLTPRVLMLCWALREESITTQQLADALGLSPDDVFALVDRVRQEVNDAARALPW